MCGGAGTFGGKCGKNRVVVSYICRDLSILLAEDPEKERKQAHSRGRRDERAGLSTDKDDKEEKCGYFWEKVPDVWKILLGAAAFSAVFNMIFWALEKKEIFLGVLHIAVQKVRMTGQAAEAVSLCLKMPQGDMLAAALGKGASEGTAALFSGALWQQFLLMGIAAPLSEELLFRGILFELPAYGAPIFLGGHLDRRHFSGWCMETGRRGFMRRSWD